MLGDAGGSEGKQRTYIVFHTEKSYSQHQLQNMVFSMNNAVPKILCLGSAREGT